jgi:hypothetical protein
VSTEIEDAAVEEPIPHELDQVTELAIAEPDRASEQRIDAGGQHSFERTLPGVGRHVVPTGVIAAQGGPDVEVVRDGSLQRAESPVRGNGSPWLKTSPNFSR